MVSSLAQRYQNQMSRYPGYQLGENTHDGGGGSTSRFAGKSKNRPLSGSNLYLGRFKSLPFSFCRGGA